MKQKKYCFLYDNTKSEPFKIRSIIYLSMFGITNLFILTGCNFISIKLAPTS